MPSYYNEVLKMPPDAAKLHLTMPHLTAMLIKLCVSQLASAARDAGYSMLATRRLMCAVGYALTGVPILLVPLLAASPVWMTTLCFCVALAGIKE